MKSLTIFLLVITTGVMQTACKSSSANSSFENISEKDSLDLVHQLFDSLDAEFINVQSGYIHQQNNIDGNLCYMPLMSTRLSIEFNGQGEYSVRGELNAGIVESVLEFYRANLEENDVTNNFPMYSTTTLEEIDRQLKDAVEAAQEMESNKGAVKEIIDFKWEVVKEWKERKKLLTILDVNELKEVRFGTEVRLRYKEGFEQREETLDSIFLAYYHLRDDASQKYFDKSYIELLYNCNEYDSLPDKLEALKLVHPLQVIDYPYCLENGLKEVLLPPPPQVYP